jgi:hypothetical protein
MEEQPNDDLVQIGFPAIVENQTCERRRPGNTYWISLPAVVFSRLVQKNVGNTPIFDDYRSVFGILPRGVR